LSNRKQIALIGFGEAATAFVEGWAGKAEAVFATFDIKVESKTTQAALLNKCQALAVACEASNADAVSGKQAVFSFVTAGQSLSAAEATACSIEKGAFFFDCNSCSPGTKRKAAQLIAEAGGRYVDVAVMAPVYPAMNKTPVSICGPNVAAAFEYMNALDMKPTLIEGDVGVASSTKMVRSIMMKGLEALMMECVLTGRQAGVDEAVLNSLEKTYPGFGWKDKAAYMAERVMVHGKRRAAEMREVAITVQELGLEGRMAAATVDWHQEIGDLALDPGEDDYESRIDSLLAALNGPKKG
jgi:3-hydroxyisobutyrate dehydrogenase-like beta-hydroxyacid dehydrogenase